MGFKLNNKPYDESDMNIPVYKRNIQDGAIGKSNHTGIVVQEGLDPLSEKAVIAHETVHQKDPHLDYDDDNFYYKGKTYPREKLNEFDRELPWEKKAYAESDKILKGKVNDIEMEKFKIGKHRGNKKPFAAMSEKGLIGPSMDYTVSEGASAEMCIMGGDDPTKPSRKSIRRCKGDKSSYKDVQGKKTKTKRVRKPKNKESKFVYTKDNLDINTAPQTIKNQPEWDVEHNTWSSQGQLKPTIKTQGGSENVSNETKKEISTRSKKSQKIINSGINRDMGGEGQTLSTPGSESGIYEGSRYKKVKRKNSSGNKVTKYKHKSSYSIDASDPSGKKTLTYTKGRKKSKTISSDNKRFDKKLERVVGKTSRKAAPRGSGDEFISKNMKKII